MDKSMGEDIGRAITTGIVLLVLLGVGGGLLIGLGLGRLFF